MAGYAVSESDIEFAKRITRGFMRKYSPSEIEYDELESVALFALCESASRYQADERATFTSFSYLRIRGALFDFLRSNRRRQTQSLVVEQEIEHGAQTHRLGDMFALERRLEKRYTRRRLTRAIMSLNPHYQRLVRLRYFDDRSFDEISILFNRSKSWVSLHHVRALEELQAIHGLRVE